MIGRLATLAVLAAAAAGGPADGTSLIVTTAVEDPECLTQEFVISSQFRKESDPVEMEFPAL